MRARALAFKLGFLTKLAQAGILPEELVLRIKAAGDDGMGLGDLLGLPMGAGKALGSAAGTAAKYTGTAAVGLPVIAGAGLGGLDAYLKSPVIEPAMMHKLEMIAQYRQATKEILDRQKAPAQ